MIAPNPVIIILVPQGATGWLRKGSKIIRKLPQKLQDPRRQRAQPIPQFDRAALRERVARFLRETQRQREDLRAMAWC
jgi:hypothetical protein